MKDEGRGPMDEGRALIRPTTDDDVAALQALVEAVCRERRYLGSTTGFSIEQTRAHLTHVWATRGVALVAVDTDGRLVGFLDITQGPYEGLTHYGRLGMGLAPSARDRGLGHALLMRALDEGFRVFDRIELEVYSSNERAIALYRALGFVEEGRRRRARRLDGLEEDIVMMGLLKSEWPRTSR